MKKRYVMFLSAAVAAAMLMSCAPAQTTGQTTDAAAATTAAAAAASTIAAAATTTAAGAPGATSAADTDGATAAAGGQDADGGSGSGEAAAESGVPNMTAPGVLSIVVEPVTLKVGVRQESQVTDWEYETNYFTKRIVDMTGIDVEFDFYPAAEESATKLELNIASNVALPDVILWIPLSRDKVEAYGQAGYFADLTDYFGQYTYFFDRQFPEGNAVSDALKDYYMNVATSDDGRIYTFAKVDAQVSNTITGEMRFNQLWLDAVGMTYPATTEELREVLSAFKTQDPNGNGQADEIPMIWPTDSFSGGSRVLLNAFEYQSIPNKLNLGADGALYHCQTSEAYREGLRYIRGLVSDGLISDLSWTMENADMRAVIDQPEGQPSIVGAYVNAMVLGQGLTERRFEYMPWERLITGPSGVGYSTRGPFAVEPSCYISGDSEMKEIAFRFLDTFFEYELAIAGRWGEKGPHWDDPLPTDTPRFDMGLPAGWRLIENWWGNPHHANWNNGSTWALGPNSVWGQAAILPVDPDNPTPTEWVAYTNIPAFKASLAPGAQPENMLTPLVWSSAEAPEVNELWTSLEDCIRTYEARFCMGELDIESDWNTYLDEMRARGLDRYIEIATGAYNRQKS